MKRSLFGVLLITGLFSAASWSKCTDTKVGFNYLTGLTGKISTSWDIVGDLTGRILKRDV